MGNRATIIFTDGERYSPAVYLHWNGGPESVYAFLEELDRREVRADAEYEAARFVQIVGEATDSGGENGLSLGIVNGPKSDSPEELEAVQTDHGDNGLYLINRNTGEFRRFLESGSNWKLEELTPETVAAEFREAETHSYRAEFRKFFQALSEHKKVEATT